MSKKTIIKGPQKPTKKEKHILDNPFKLTWPHHDEQLTEDTLLTLKQFINDQYLTCCKSDETFVDLRGKRKFGHKLEQDKTLIFSINNIAKMFERQETFKLVCVEKSILTTKIFDHILYFCSLTKTPLIKGPLSDYLSAVLGRKKIAILGVPTTANITIASELQYPALPFLPSTLPAISVRVLDATPSQKTFEASLGKRKRRLEKNEARKKFKLEEKQRKGRGLPKLNY